MTKAPAAATLLLVPACSSWFTRTPIDLHTARTKSARPRPKPKPSSSRPRPRASSYKPRPRPRPRPSSSRPRPRQRPRSSSFRPRPRPRPSSSRPKMCNYQHVLNILKHLQKCFATCLKKVSSYVLPRPNCNKRHPKSCLCFSQGMDDELYIRSDRSQLNLVLADLNEKIDRRSVFSLRPASIPN